MILQCTECNARFLVPDAAIGTAGRNVRCGKCRHTWFQQGVAATVTDLDKMLGEIEVKLKPVPKGSNVPVLHNEKVPMGLKAAAGGVAAVALVFALLFMAPGLLGQPRSAALALADIKMVKQEKEGGRAAYEISGKIINTGSDTMSIPTLNIALLGPDNSVLQQWESSGQGEKLGAGNSLEFSKVIEPGFTTGERFVLDLGTGLELALRRKPE